MIIANIWMVGAQPLGVYRGRTGNHDTLMHMETIKEPFGPLEYTTGRMGKHGTLIHRETIKAIELSPVPCMVYQPTYAACGAEFTVWLSDGVSSILSAGLPQYGQLGHGTDNENKSNEGSEKLVYEPQPRPREISAFSDKTAVKVACGTNHTVAIDSSGFLYTWGCGKYGRLGHNEQKDEWTPRLVEIFQGCNILPPTAIISAGAVSSACTADLGQLYMWGRLENNGDDLMYPKPVWDLCGWLIQCMDSSDIHHVVGTDDSCFSWGVARFGELGYGHLGPKSSANPKKVETLDGLYVKHVACGLGFSLIVVDRTAAADLLEQLEVCGEDDAEGDEDITTHARYGRVYHRKRRTHYGRVYHRRQRTSLMSPKL